jgi:hypothetical protein
MNVNENNNQKNSEEEYKTDDVDVKMEYQKFEMNEVYKSNDADFDVNDNMEYQKLEMDTNHEEFKTNDADFDVNDYMEYQIYPNHESEENVAEYDLFTQAPTSLFLKNNLQEDFDNSTCVEKLDHPGWGHSSHPPSYRQSIIPDDQQNTLKNLSWSKLYNYVNLFQEICNLMINRPNLINFLQNL